MSKLSQEERKGFKKALSTKMSKEPPTDYYFCFEDALAEFLTEEVGPDNYWFKLDPSEDGAIGIIHVWGEKFEGDENEE